jgi:hypothetical protein
VPAVVAGLLLSACPLVGPLLLLDCSAAPAGSLLSSPEPAVNGLAASKRAKLSHSKKLPKAIVLDIEGTVAPISFVAEVMFSYARQHVKQHLEERYDVQETINDIEAIRKQV